MSLRELTASILTHLPFEDLGSLEPELLRRGFTVRQIDVPSTQIPLHEAADCDLMVVLGGPIGVYDTAEFPFLHEEMQALRQRLDARQPTVGICLGAQLMAAALGAPVFPGKAGAEIGWFPLQPVEGVAAPDWFAPLLANDQPVFHWHGDTFDLPAGAKLLARSEQYEKQAFAVGDHGLALQFHPEVTARGLERWYVGHIGELHAKHISVNELRSETQRYASGLQAKTAEFWRLWLDHIL